MEATITKNGLVYSVDMKTIYYADDSGEFKGTIPNGVERIEDEAFSCCAVEKIYIPDSVTSVGANLFENATSLKSVRLPSGLKKLSPYMFAGCSSLEQIEMSFEIESFEEGLFAGCSSLKEIPFRAGIKELPNYVFSGCSELRSLILPNTIEKICEGAVSDCENLTTLVLPASLKEIEEGAFEGCFNLCHIRLNGENGYFRVDDAESSLYRKNPDGTETLILHLEGNTLSEVPTFHEVDESAPVSILDFNEEDDIADDDSDIILTQEELDKVCPRTEDSSEDIMQKHETVISSPIQNQFTEESNADVADRLAEIMGQSSVSTSDEISADEIPYATAEELEAGRLAPSAQVAQESENAECEEEIPQDEVVECEESAEVPQAEDDMSSRLAEIMGQSSVSTSDEISADEIPYATAEELEAGRLAPSAQVAQESENAECEEEIPQDEVVECEESAEVPQAEDDMSSRLAEIMGQSSVSTSDEISADEIPYATAEELEAGRLAPSAQVAEETENAEYEEEIPQDEVAECEESAEVPHAEDDMSSRLAEIMGQSSVSTSDEISADEIPYATAEELEAGRLAPSAQVAEETENAEYEEEIPQDEVAECEESAEVPQAEDGESTEITEETEYLENTETGGKLLEAEITENMDEFENTEMIENMEIAENPEVSQDITEEVSSVSDEVALETEEVSSCEETASEEVISDTAEYEEVFFEMDEGEYSSCIEDYFFGIGRYETIAMETSCDEEKTLYVFAKSLNAEHNFSSKLISCCRRLANVHNYSQVKLLSNPQFIEENREKFSDFMKEKDVIYACSVDSLSLMTEDEKDLCGLLGIALDRDGLIEQSKTASDKNAPFIKLLIQDNME